MRKRRKILHCTYLLEMKINYIILYSSDNDVQQLFTNITRNYYTFKCNSTYYYNIFTSTIHTNQEYYITITKSFNHSFCLVPIVLCRHSLVLLHVSYPQQTVPPFLFVLPSADISATKNKHIRV
jgi:hypothetical protein